MVRIPLVFFMRPRPPRSTRTDTLFPYPTLFRSAAAFFILMVDGFDSLVIAYVAPLISEAMRLEPTDIGKLFAASTIGSIFGALVMGPLADRHGRKPILIIALIITTVTTFA